MKTLGKIIRSKAFIIAVAVVLFYTLAGFFLLPFLVRHYTPKIVEEKIAKKASIGVVRFNPYVFTFEANELRITEPDGSPLVGFERLFVDFELKSLFKRAWIFREVSLEGPAVRAVIGKDGRLNLSSLAPPAGQPPAKEEGGPLPRLVLEEIRIESGRVDAIDRRQSQPAAITIHPLSLQLKNYTTLPGQWGDQVFTATTSHGETFRWKGRTSLNPVAAKGELSVENLKISTLSQYARDSLNLEPPAGKVTFKSEYTVDSSGGDIQILLSNLSVALAGVGLRLQGAETPFLELPEALLSNGRIDLIGRSVEIGGISVQGGKARLAVREDGTLDLAGMARAFGEGAPEKSAQGPGRPWKISLNRFELGGFAFDYKDRSRTPGMDAAVERLDVRLKAVIESGTQTKAEVSDLTLGVSGLQAGFADSPEPVLRVDKVGLQGGAYHLEGNRFTAEAVSVEGGRADVRVLQDGGLNLALLFQPAKGAAPKPSQGPGSPWKISLNRFELGGFAFDYKDRSRTPGMDAALERIEVGFKAELEAGMQTKADVSDLTLGVSGLQAGFPDSPEPVLRVDKVGLQGGAYHLEGNRFTAEAVSVEGGRADVRRLRDGGLNLALLFQPAKGAAPKKLDEAEEQGQPLDFLVNRVSLSGLQTVLSDLAVREDGPVIALEDVSATLSNVDGRSPMPFDLGIRVREGGRISAAGTVDPSAPSVDSEVRVEDLGLTPFQPYIGNAAEVLLRSGTFSTRGKLRHGIPSSGAQTAYDGGFRCERLQVTDKSGGETLVGWKSVRSDQLKLRLGPNEVDVGDVTVSQLTGKIVIEKDGRFNLAQVIKTDPKPGEGPGKAAEGAAAAFPYRVRRVLVSDGRVDFADLSLPIPFGTKIHALKGSIAGISSTGNARARVKLDGRVDDYGTAQVEGELNTSDPKAFTDIGVVFRNVEMSRLTPYSGKFAGRKIDSGKLSVDLKYKIKDSVLAGENKLVVERLKLGEKIESPTAVNLPLDLAVALLEDSNGVIDLGLQVQGNLDSPEFSYSALIMKAVVSVLTKIVTSPFRILAALIPGGGEETLKSVAFEAGSAEVPPPEKEKLARLAGALQKRPQLKLTVQGRYSPGADRQVLRAEGLGRALAARLGRKHRTGLDPGPVDYNSPETVKALEALFSERFGVDALDSVRSELKGARDKAAMEPAEKGKTGARIGEAEDPAELAKLLFRRLEQVEPVDEAALVRLAESRAQAVVAELSGPLAIPAERLGTAAPGALGDSDPIAAALSLEIAR